MSVIDSESQLFDVAVIGGGAAGQMAALRAVLNHLNTVFFLGDAKTIKRSRATWVSEVDNIPGFFHIKHPITATTRQVIAYLQKKPDLSAFLTPIKSAVSEVTKESTHFILKSGSNVIRSKFVVLCTGTMDVQPEIAGSIESVFPYANRNEILYCIRCDGHRTVGHRCAVIGSSESAGWIAVMLKERYQLNEIWILSHGKKFEPSSEVKTLIDLYKIRVEEGVIDRILGDPKKGLEGFWIGNRAIAVTRAFVAMGSIVYNELAQQLGVQLDKRQHVITNEYGETSVPGFYAAGDLVSGRKKQVYTAWDMAVDAIDDIDEKIRIMRRPPQ